MKKRNGDITRANILKAAEDVFAENGYIGTTIRKVARRANISIGAIYLYFPNKETLYTELMRQQINAFCKHTESVKDSEPVEALKFIVESYLFYALKKKKVLSANIKEYDLELKKPLKKRFIKYQKRLISEILGKGISEGKFKHQDCNETANVILSCLRGAILSYLSGEIRDIKKYGHALFNIILDGIRSDKYAE